MPVNRLTDLIKKKNLSKNSYIWTKSFLQLKAFVSIAKFGNFKIEKIQQIGLDILIYINYKVD